VLLSEEGTCGGIVWSSTPQARGDGDRARVDDQRNPDKLARCRAALVPVAIPVVTRPALLVLALEPAQTAASS
jgi:hypothetical protein